jgi:hypothetical protein
MKASPQMLEDWLAWVPEHIENFSILFDLKGNGREGIPSLTPPHQLEKALDISHTTYYLLLPSLAININN